MDERLLATSFFLGDWPLSSVLLKNERNYPWFLIVPRKEHIYELCELDQEDQWLLMQEINQLSLLIKAHYQPCKLNIGSLGNIVQQLHIHCVARNEHDPLWPQGIWQSSYHSTPYPEEIVNNLVSHWRSVIANTVF